jgi:hypothetical protein
MGNLLFWLGLGAAQKGAGSKALDRRNRALSFAVGTLLALLIAAGMFILLVSQHFVLGTSQEGPAVASTNKSLAQMNKSLDGG